MTPILYRAYKFSQEGIGRDMKIDRYSRIEEFFKNLKGKSRLVRNLYATGLRKFRKYKVDEHSKMGAMLSACGTDGIMPKD